MTTSVNTFDGTTEAKEVVSTFLDEVRGKNILITGVGPNGLGANLALNLAAQHPALLILTGRTPSKVSAVADTILTYYPNVSIRVLEMDLSSFDSVRRAVREVNAYQERSIDILINNAGVMNIPERRLSSDGFELHLATNYLGTFLFTTEILDKLAFSGKARVVNVGSNGYSFSPFRFADYNFEGKTLPENEKPPKELCEQFGIPWSLGYTPTIAYGQSKTALLLFTVQLAKEFGSRGVTAICVHPGAIATGLWRHMPKASAEQLFKVMPMKIPTQGTSTILVAALDPKLSGSSGAYLVDCQPVSVMEFAKDEASAKKLWDLSRTWTGP